jgi:hypothetical protein
VIIVSEDDCVDVNTTRRTLLSTCGLGTLAILAGCLGGASGDDGDGTDTGLPTDTTDDSGDTRPSGTGGPGLALVSTDERPDAPVRPEIEVTQDTATADHPPGLRATVTNEGDRTLTLGEGRDIIFAYRYDTSEQLQLLPTGSDYPAEPDCWRLTEPIAVTEEYQMVTLEPGESTSRDLELYGAPGEDACLPVGNFRFESPFSVMDEPDGEEVASFAWGFEVSLE